MHIMQAQEQPKRMKWQLHNETKFGRKTLLQFLRQNSISMSFQTPCYLNSDPFEIM